MGNFDIAFTGDHLKGDSLIAMGRIQLGEYSEIFDAFVGYWPIERYRISWITELRRLTGGADTACLLTSVWYPRDANLPEAWALYRFGDLVRVQPRVIVLDQHDHLFNPDEPWKSIPSYAEVEDGKRISEWRISFADIEEFLARTTTYDDGGGDAYT